MVRKKVSYLFLTEFKNYSYFSIKFGMEPFRSMLNSFDEKLSTSPDINHIVLKCCEKQNCDKYSIALHRLTVRKNCKFNTKINFLSEISWWRK